MFLLLYLFILFVILLFGLLFPILRYLLVLALIVADKKTARLLPPYIESSKDVLTSVS